MDYRNISMQMLFSAMALVGNYAEAANHVKPVSQFETACNYASLVKIRETLIQLTIGWKELDVIFSEAVRTTLKRGDASRQDFARISELVHAVRGLESALATSTPPSDVGSAHTAFRRVVAGVRGRLVQLENLHKQAVAAHAYVDTGINFEGLKALADHTSARMAIIA